MEPSKAQKLKFLVPLKAAEVVGLKIDYLTFIWRVVKQGNPLPYAVNPVTIPPPPYRCICRKMNQRGIRLWYTKHTSKWGEELH